MGLLIHQNALPTVYVIGSEPGDAPATVVQIAKTNAPLANGTGIINTDSGDGRTRYTFAAGETDTVGDLTLLLLDAGGNFLAHRYFQVVSFDPNGPNYATGGGADPLLNPVPGSYAPGTAGYVLGKNLNAAISAVIYFLTTGKFPPGR